MAASQAYLDGRSSRYARKAACLYSTVAGVAEWYRGRFELAGEQRHEHSRIVKRRGAPNARGKKARKAGKA